MSKVHPLRYIASIGVDLAAIGVLATTGYQIHEFYYHYEGRSPLLTVMGLLVVSAGIHGCARHLRGKDRQSISPTLESKVDYQI